MKLFIIVVILFGVYGCSTSNIKSHELPELSREQIQSVFRENSYLVYSVYNEALKRQPNLTGKIILRVRAVYNQPNTCDTESVTEGLEDIAAKICKNVEEVDFGRGKTKEFSYPIVLSQD